MKHLNSKGFWLIAGPLLFLLILLLYHPQGLEPAGVAVLATAVWMAIWWIAEAVPIAVTSLLPIVLFPLTGGLGIGETTAAFGDKIIFLYMGSFLIAIAIERWNLHKRIALQIIYLIGTDLSKIILGFMIATAMLSMWISNTATAVMMFPIGLSVVRQFGKDRQGAAISEEVFGKAIMLAIAYSASIGGMATLIGTPPNLVFAGVVQKVFGKEITFLNWLIIGLPVSILLLAIGWRYLVYHAFRLKNIHFPAGKEEIGKQLKTLGPMQKEEVRVIWVFTITALIWIFRGLLEKLIHGLDDTIPAILAGISLFIIPAKREKRNLITWEDALKMPWGIFLLFGGGLALAAGFSSSGLAAWIAGQFVAFQYLPLLILLFLLVAAVNFLTEITSNTATTAMLLPILAPLALSIHANPYELMIAATLAASCAFMLPVATPPNAIVFGSGYLRIPDMVRTGIVMNIISILLVGLFIYFILPHLHVFAEFVAQHGIGVGK